MRIYLFVLWTTFFLTPAKKGELVLEIKNIESACGVLQIAVYDEPHFLEEGKALFQTTTLVQTQQDLRIPITNIPFGRYAIAAYHDVNNNGKLDKNYLGIPVEPYAFSNNPRVKWRSPTFEETQIELNTLQKDIPLELKRWRKH